MSAKRPEDELTGRERWQGEARRAETGTWLSRLAGMVVIAALSIVPVGAQESAQGATLAALIAAARDPGAGEIELEAELAADPAAEAAWLAEMSLGLAGEPADLAERQRHAATMLRLRGRRLAARAPDWPDAQSDAYLALLLIDPRRFIYDIDFRLNVVPVIAAAMADEVPAAARARMATQLRGFDFGLIERVEVAWSLAPRSSRSREVRFEAVDLHFGAVDPIRASIYSLPSAYFRFDEAAAFLRSVYAVAPHRQVVVLSNEPLITELRRLRDEMQLHLIDTLGRAYSPWPRDPFVAAQSARGPVTLVVRPNLQAQRELDVFMAREIVQNLPDELDRDWQRVQWTLAPVPFHGGHTLTTPQATWASVHTLLPRIREILGARGPIDLQSLRRPQVLQRFLAAARTAAAEFEAAFGKPVRLIHPLPQSDAAAEVDALEVVMGGGDGRDLDSIVTIVDAGDGRPAALVGDLARGRQAIERASAEELRRVGELYHLLPRGDELRRELARAQSTVPNQQFDAYLDAVAAHLRRLGLRVERLPLVHVPVGMMEEALRYERDSFMISWNNVVIEQGSEGLRAEGFASGFDGVDAAVRDTFANIGVALDYVAPLALSVMRDGGYRCASNHVR